MLATTIFCLCAYLLGSISSAILIAKTMRLKDPRTAGSGNPGATNMLRLNGKGPAFFTLLGDLLKGYLPTGLAVLLSFSPFQTALVASAAILGHLYPIFFRFAGGKGVATFLGALLAISPLAALGWVILWVAVAKIGRYVSVASLLATLSTPGFLWFTTHERAVVLAFTLLALIVLLRHRANIRNLLAGREHRVPGKGS